MKLCVDIFTALSSLAATFLAVFAVLPFQLTDWGMLPVDNNVFTFPHNALHFLPYLPSRLEYYYFTNPRCVIHATILNTRAEAYSDMLEGDCVAEMALHNPQLGNLQYSSFSFCALFVPFLVCVKSRF